MPDGSITKVELVHTDSRGERYVLKLHSQFSYDNGKTFSGMTYKFLLTREMVEFLGEDCASLLSGGPNGRDTPR